MRTFDKTFLAVVLAAGSLWGAAVTAPAPELVKYVLDARRHGLKDNALKKNAVAAGWPENLINDAIDYLDNAKTAAPAAKAADSRPVLSSEANLNAGTPAAVRSPEVPPPPAAKAPAPAEPNRLPDTVGPAIKERGVPEDYQIGAGDILQISVWKEPEASVPSVVVRPDGRITMPLLKEVSVAGITPQQAEKIITERLTDLIRGADVTVIVTSITSKKIYVVGAARREGPIPYTYRMTIMQAISEAGGLTDYAKRSKIYVLHSDNGKEYRLPFNYDEVIKGERMEQNIYLSAGDTLLIPR